MSEPTDGPPANEPTVNPPPETAADVSPVPPASASAVSSGSAVSNPVPTDSSPPPPLGLPAVATPPEPRPPQAPAPSPAKEFLKKVLAEVRKTLDFYLANRKALGMAYADRFALLPKSMSAGRDIRLSEEDHDDDATRTDAGWDIRLPDCCVVCGEPTDRDWQNEVKSVLDLSWPMYAPLVGLVGGVVLNWYFDTRWGLPLALIAGFVAGYRGCRQLEVQLRLKRCAEHVQRVNVPGVRAVAGDLVVRVGNRRVKQKFKNPEASGWEMATPKGPGTPDETPSVFPTADNIPEPGIIEPGQLMKLDDGPITGQVHSFQQMPGETGSILSPSDDAARDANKPTNGQAHDPL